MNLKITIGILALAFAAASLADMVDPAEPSLASELRSAPIVCSARLVGYQFDDLRPGEVRTTSERSSLALRYVVLHVYRNSTHAIRSGETVSIGRSGVEGDGEWQVALDGGKLHFSRKSDWLGGGWLDVTYKFPLGSTVLLLLRDNHSYFGTHQDWWDWSAGAGWELLQMRRPQ